MSYRNILQQTAQDLVRKNLLTPALASGLKLNPRLMDTAYHNWMKEGFFEYTCPICSLFVKGPRKFITDHMTTHAIKFREKGNGMENEQFKINYNRYKV